MMQASDANDSAYDSGGTGSVLVLLHGLGGTWHIWKPILSLLSARHRVLALTLPGHLGGPALRAGQEPTVDAMADVLEEELTRRGIENPHLVGNSLGGWLSLELARRGVARSVTALSPAGGWSTKAEYLKVARPFKIVFALLPILIPLLSWFMRFAGVRKALNAQAMEHADRLSPEEARRAMNSLRHTKILPPLLRAMEDHGPIKPMRAGKTLIRIAWSEHDKVIPFDPYGRCVVGAIDGCDSIVVRDVGHVPMYDDPQQVAKTILDATDQSEAEADTKVAA